jgi:hypothetical protein
MKSTKTTKAAITNAIPLGARHNASNAGQASQTHNKTIPTLPNISEAKAEPLGINDGCNLKANEIAIKAIDKVNAIQRTCAKSLGAPALLLSFLALEWGFRFCGALGLS